MKIRKVKLDQKNEICICTANEKINFDSHPNQQQTRREVETKTNNQLELVLRDTRPEKHDTKTP